MKNINIVFIFFLFIITSCSKDEGIKNNEPQADFTYSDEIDHLILEDNSIDADEDYLSYLWSVTPATIEIANPISPTAFLYLPSEATQVSVTLIVKDDYSSNSITKEFILPEGTTARNYGLGRDVIEEHSNNCNYSWYYSQSTTGTYSYENCGPTSITMAVK